MADPGQLEDAHDAWRVISPRDDKSDIVEALEAGADDYLVKPVAIKELTARLRALHRPAAAPRPGNR